MPSVTTMAPPTRSGGVSRNACRNAPNNCVPLFSGSSRRVSTTRVSTLSSWANCFSSAAFAAFDQLLRISLLFEAGGGPVPMRNQEAEDTHRKGCDIHCEEGTPHAGKHRNCERRIRWIAGDARNGIAHDGLDRPSGRWRGQRKGQRPKARHAAPRCRVGRPFGWRVGSHDVTASEGQDRERQTQSTTLHRRNASRLRQW